MLPLSRLPRREGTNFRALGILKDGEYDRARVGGKAGAVLRKPSSERPETYSTSEGRRNASPSRRTRCRPIAGRTRRAVHDREFCVPAAEDDWPAETVLANRIG